MFMLNHMVGFGAYKRETLAAAFPVIAATNTSLISGGVTSSHPVSMPSGIAAGNLLLAIASIQSAGATTVTDPSGWTRFIDQEQIGSTTGVALLAWYKVAAGGDTCTFGTSASRWSAHNSYRITGYQGTPEGASSAGQSASPNPPLLTPTWGVNRTMFLSVAAVRSGTTAAFSSAPANYTDLLDAATAGGIAGNNVRTGSARREVTGGSEDPGNFTLSVGTQDWVAGTIAIRPA